MTRRSATPGFVFCARVADHPTAQYSYVEDSDGFNDVVEDTLACLAHARPDHGSDQTRVLAEDTHARAYLAWEAARKAIHERWMVATDPANLVPAVPRTMRDAAVLLREHPLGDTTQPEIDKLIDAVEQPYPQRIQQQIRAAIRSSEHPLAQAEAVAAKARELGLQAAPAPEPLPVIVEEDIHLVCWLAITPE